MNGALITVLCDGAFYSFALECLDRTRQQLIEDTFMRFRAL